MKAIIKAVTERELIDEAESLSQSTLGVSHQEAFRRLDQGEFRGTIFADKMDGIRFLMAAGERKS